MMVCVADLAVRVRSAVQTDAAAIGETHAAAWTTAYDHIFEASFLARAADGRRVGWRQSLPGLLVAPSFVLVAECDGRVMGFAHAGPEPANPGAAEIFGFYVHPAVWGSGVADHLMTHTCSVLADDTTEVVVWTFRDAARARRFYERADFRTTGRTRDEALSDWTSGVTVERPAVEYLKSLPGALRTRTR
jgi:ribosomal protein S18 acetylase RimI-like enzyme